MLGVLAVLLLVASGIAVWARATLFDSDKVASIASNVFADPAVDEALADRMTDYVFEAVDVNTIVGTVLPDQLDRLQPTIVAGMESAVDRTLTRILESNAGQELLTNVVRRAHAAAMELLQGDGLVDGVSVVEGEVTINLLPLVGRGLTRIQDFGLLDDVELPTVTADGDPDEQIADLEAALGRDLPDDFGQLVVYRSDRLADAQAAVQSAQQLLVTVKRALWVLLIAAVVSLVLTIVLARDRWRAILLLGLGTFVATVAARTAVRNVRDDAPELVERPGAKAAVTVVLDDLSAGLLRMFGLLLLVAVALDRDRVLPAPAPARRPPPHRVRRRWSRGGRSPGVEHRDAHRRRPRGRCRRGGRSAAAPESVAGVACRDLTSGSSPLEHVHVERNNLDRLHLWSTSRPRCPLGRHPRVSPRPMIRSSRCAADASTSWR